VAVQQFRSALQSQLEEIEKAGTYKRERVITSPQTTSINVKGSDGKILNFCANNYLGLSVTVFS
jgi:glycine C-acetyltransferase